MDTRLTFGMIKPDVIQDKQMGKVITQIEENGFTFIGLRYEQMNLEQARAFYAVHRERPFYQELCDYMASGPVVVMCLEKEDAVAAFRKLIGATNPVDAAEGTIRKKFGKSVMENAVHGSDSESNAAQELAFFFGCGPSCECC